MWEGTTDDVYSIKSGYNFHMRKQVINTSSTSVVDQNPRLWNSVWNSGCFSRSNDLLWRGCRDILPVSASLRVKNVDVDLMCVRCGCEEEIVLHAFVGSPFAQAVWFARPLALRVETFLYAGFLEFVKVIFVPSDAVFRVLLAA